MVKMAIKDGVKMKHLITIVLLFISATAFSQAGAGIRYVDTIPTHTPNPMLRHSTVVRDLSKDQLYNFDRNEWKRLTNETEILFAVDSIEQIVSMDTTVDFRVGDRIINRSTGAQYLIQPDSVAGYETDTVAVTPVGSSYAVLQPDADGFFNLSHFGLDTSLTDNYTPFSKAYTMAASTGGFMKVEKPGIYRFNTEFQDIFSDTDFYLKGIGNIVFQIDNEEWLTIINRELTTFSPDSLISPNLKGSDTLHIRNASALGRGDVITINQADIVPGIGQKTDVLEVRTVLNDTTVLLIDSMLFNHIDTNTFNFVRVSKKHSFRLEGIDFNFKFNYTVPGFFGINIRAFNDVQIRDVEFINDTYDSQLADGVSIYGSVNIQIQNTKYRNLRYGSLINAVDRLRIVNAYVEDCRHLSAISSWAKNVYVSDVTAYHCRTPIESHFGWNAHYNNITSYQKGKITLRSFGDLKITNCDITTTNTEDTESIYSLIGYHFANDSLEGTEFEWLVNKTNILIDNVNYEELNRTSGGFTGLSATAFQTLTIRNSKASSMGAYVNSVVDNSRLKIENSTMGRLFARSGANLITINNVIFDGDLNTGSAVLSHSQADTLIINNAIFLNCDTFHLEDVWEASGAVGGYGEYQFHSVSGTVKSPTGSIITGSIASAKPMRFYNSDLIFTDTFVPQYLAEDTEDLFQLSNSSLTWSDIVLYDTYRAHTIEDEYISFNDINKKVKIDSLGLHFNRSAGGYNGGIHGTNPRTGVQDNDVHIFSNDRIEFHGSSGTVDLGYMSTLNFTLNVPFVISGANPDFASFGNDDLTIRAGDGNAARIGDVILTVKDNQEVARFNDSQEVQINGITDQGAYNLQVEGDVYFDDQLVATDHKQYGNEASSTNASGEITVTFPTAFTVAPAAILITSRTSGHHYAVTARSTTSFTIVAADGADAVLNTVAVDFDWLAIR